MSSRIPCAHSRWTWRPSSRHRETFYWHVTMKLGAQVAKLGIAAVLKTASRKGAQVRILPWAYPPRANESFGVNVATLAHPDGNKVLSGLRDIAGSTDNEDEDLEGSSLTRKLCPVSVRH